MELVRCEELTNGCINCGNLLGQGRFSDLDAFVKGA